MQKRLATVQSVEISGEIRIKSGLIPNIASLSEVKKV
jgi:hypothetical protein